MTSTSDALVVFGIMGDLAYKQIFPALQAMVKRGHHQFPIIGVARSRDLDRLRARTRDSVEEHGGVDENAFAQLSANLEYVTSDYQDDPKNIATYPPADLRVERIGDLIGWDLDTLRGVSPPRSRTQGSAS